MFNTLQERKKLISQCFTDSTIAKGEETEKLVEEHKRLVDVLESPSHEDDKQEAEKQKEELKDLEAELEKGKKVPIGTITNGYKKVAEGKWKKVSKYGMTQSEHLKKFREHDDAANELHSFVGSAGSNVEVNLTQREYHMAQREKHRSQLKRVDNKEYDDKHVMGQSEKIFNKGEDGLTPFQHQEMMKSRIASCFVGESLSEEELEKSANDYFEKGKKAAIGEKRMFGGKPYIKTANGWRLVGKNKGKHKEAAETLHGKKGSKPSMKQVKEILGERMRRGRVAINTKVEKNPDGTVAIWPGAYEDINELKQFLEANDIKTSIANFKDHGGVSNSKILILS